MEPISFQGPITVVDNISKAEEALDKLFAAKCIGFDTESRPAFFKGQKFPVSIIQLATNEEAFIFQLKYVRFAGRLVELLSDESIIKVGVGVQDDIRRLNELCKFKHGGFFDLSAEMKRKGVVQSGARALTARYLGRKLVKSSQKTNWAVSRLTERQLEYAATDAWICLQLLDYVKNDKTDYRALIAAEQESGNIIDDADHHNDE
ncbi:MAG: 3'-5' exonuclease domain-containing protein 2 [Mucispirillum sp.]|nr:3'-5' exonuclease domain-containing protein 2 [Mucispirillum sp.]